MKRIKGVEIVETADSMYPDAKDLRSLTRQVDLGYKRFMERRGLLANGGFKAAVRAGVAEAVAEKHRKAEISPALPPC